MYRFFLDGTQVNPPENWEDLTTEIGFDKTTRVFTQKFTSKYVFSLDGYEYLKEKFSENFCGIIEFKVQKECNDNTFTNILDGNIFLSDISFDLCKCKATVGAAEKSFQTFIKNNQKIKANVGSSQSKNSTTLAPITITKPTPILHESYFIEEGTTTVQPVTIQGYPVDEVLTFLVEFMSDGELKFASTWYAGLSSDEKLSIASGEAIRLGNGAGQTPEITWFELTDTLIKIFNLVIIPDGDVIRLEKESYLTSKPAEIEITATNNLMFATDTSKLYSGIKVGSKTHSTTQGLFGRLPLVNCDTFRTEDFHIQSKCNVGDVLDLQYELLTDHNLMYEAYIEQSTENDKKTFLLHYNNTGSGNSLGKLDYNNPVAYVHNYFFMNCRIIQRYTFHGDLSHFVGDNPEAFYAVSNEANPAFATVGFFLGPLNIQDFVLRLVDDYDVGFDPQNNYGNGVAQGSPVLNADQFFTAPIDGVYNFRFDHSLYIGHSGAEYLSALAVDTGLATDKDKYDPFWQYHFVHLNSSGSEIARISTIEYDGQFAYQYPSNNTNNSFLFLQPPYAGVGYGSAETFSFNLLAGEKVQIRMDVDRFMSDPKHGEMFLRSQGQLQLTSSDGGGGIFLSGQDVTSFNLGTLSFDACLSNSEVLSILETKERAIVVDSACFKKVEGYIDKVTIEHKTNTATFKLRLKNEL